MSYVQYFRHVDPPTPREKLSQTITHIVALYLTASVSTISKLNCSPLLWLLTSVHFNCEGYFMTVTLMV